MVLIQSSGVRIDAAKSAGLPETDRAGADTFVVRGIETEGAERGDRGASIRIQSRCMRNVATIRCGCGLNRSSPAKCEGACNCGRRCVFIEECSVARVVDVGSDEVVQTNVPNVVRSENHSRTQLALEPHVHLNRPWRLVVGIEQTGRELAAVHESTGN